MLFPDILLLNSFRLTAIFEAINCFSNHEMCLCVGNPRLGQHGSRNPGKQHTGRVPMGTIDSMLETKLVVEDVIGVPL